MTRVVLVEIVSKQHAWTIHQRRISSSMTPYQILHGQAVLSNVVFLNTRDLLFKTRNARPYGFALTVVPVVPGVEIFSKGTSGVGIVLRYCLIMETSRFRKVVFENTLEYGKCRK